MRRCRNKENLLLLLLHLLQKDALWYLCGLPNRKSMVGVCSNRCPCNSIWSICILVEFHKWWIAISHRIFHSFIGTMPKTIFASKMMFHYQYTSKIIRRSWFKWVKGCWTNQFPGRDCVIFWMTQLILQRPTEKLWLGSPNCCPRRRAFIVATTNYL